MAKSLGIRVPSGHTTNPAIVNTDVLSPVTPSGNLGSIVASILDAQVDPSRVLIDLTARKVFADTVSANTVKAVSVLEAANGASPDGAFALSDPTKKSAPWNADGIDAYGISAPDGETWATIAAMRPSVPSMSLSGLISAFEDARVDGVTGALTGNVLILVDQGTARVTACAFDTEAHKNTALAAAAVSPAIAFEQYDASAASPSNQPFE